jgi:NAD-specific glutamate dehydrogenase
MTNLDTDLTDLVNAVVKAMVAAQATQEIEGAIAICDEIRRLPDNLVTEVLNAVMLDLMKIDPALCRWFTLDIFLHNADPEGKADVAERINLLMADLHAQ